MSTLALTRKVTEEIVIGDNLITIRVERIEGNRVVIAVDAPDAMSVHRSELYHSIKRKSSRKGANNHATRSY